MLAQRRSLVLNADYLPLATWPLSLTSAQDAATIVYVKNRAHLVEDWGEAFHTARASYPVPKVIALNNYVDIHAEPKFCRRSVYLRDRYCCQYCGMRFPTEELSYDHVVPKAHGGRTVWSNILTCCTDCNAAKGAKTAGHSGRKGVGTWRPLKEPGSRHHSSFSKLAWSSLTITITPTLVRGSTGTQS